MDLIDWITSSEFDSFNDDWLNDVGCLEQSAQISFIRKLFELHKLNKYSISTQALNRIIRHPSKINAGVYIVIRSICLYKEASRFLYDRELYDIIYNIYDCHEYDKVSELWENIKECQLFNICIGNNYSCLKAASSNNKKYDMTIEIAKDNSCKIIFGKKKSLPYKEMANELRANVPNCLYSNHSWTVPASSYIYLMEYIANNDKLDFKIELQNRRNDLELRHGVYPHNIIFCEGFRSNSPHTITATTNYHWCGGRAFFGCPGIVEKTHYADYTLFDLMNILSLQIDERRMSFFYGSLNWFSKYLEHLYCRKCNMMLEPKDTQSINARRITRYYCTNPACTAHNQEVYINHCFQEGCSNVIDSRDSKRCSNGFVVCNKCGVCCSEQQFKYKKDAGFSIPNFKFHLENNKFFCPKCGSQLVNDLHQIGFKFCPLCKEDYSGYFPRNTKEHIKLNKLTLEEDIKWRMENYQTNQ